MKIADFARKPCGMVQGPVHFVAHPSSLLLKFSWMSPTLALWTGGDWVSSSIYEMLVGEVRIELGAVGYSL